MSQPVATWRVVAAGAVVGALALALGAQAFTPTHPPPAPTEPVTEPEPTEASAGSRSTAASTTSEAVSSTTTTVVVFRAGDEIRASLHEALAAWGVFAGTGDLQDVEGFFDREGPQWATLTAEAGTTGNAFEARIEERSLVYGAAKATLRATISFVGDGDARLAADWEIELRPGRDGRWLIWSVREVESGPEPGR